MLVPSLHSFPAPYRAECLRRPVMQYRRLHRRREIKGRRYRSSLTCFDEMSPPRCRIRCVYFLGFRLHLAPLRQASAGLCDARAAMLILAVISDNSNKIELRDILRFVILPTVANRNPFLLAIVVQVSSAPRI